MAVPTFLIHLRTVGTFLVMNQSEFRILLFKKKKSTVAFYAICTKETTLAFSIAKSLHKMLFAC